MTPNVVIADDHAMIRKGIKLLLMSRLSLKNVDEAGSCSEVMSKLKHGQCTHLILDVVFPDGTSLEIVPVIKKLYPGIKIMIFSMQLGEIYSEAFRQYNIHYYLNKSSNEEETISYITRFLNDERPLTENKDTSGNNPFSSLSPRELEIMNYLLNGHKTNDIARMLNLGDSTVSTFKKRIFEKTGSSNIPQLIEMASVHILSTNDHPDRNE